MHNGGRISISKSHKSKAPSASQAAAAAVSEHLQKQTARWEIQAVAGGSTDPAAQLQAARILHQLVQYLHQHRSTCKSGAVRVLLQKQLPPELLLTLLSSVQEEVVDLTLHAMHELAATAPAVVPVDVAPRLLQLLACRNHGAAAARVLTAQLSHWRFSQLWPHWLAAGSTSTVQQQLQQLHTLCEATQSLSSNAASKAADGCVSMLMLLAKLMLLSEAQMLQQLAPDSQTASRWLQLLVQIGRQHALLAGPASLQLQDACCALLAGLSHAATTTLALAGSSRLRQEVVQLLHGVLRRPCCVSEADASHIQCWMHAAAAASLPVLWQQQHQPPQQQQQQQAAPLLSPHEEQQLLIDVAISAAATLCNECFSVTTVAKQVDGAAANLLAAALLPSEGPYGSQRNCTSRFMAAVLGSSCCHVLLHALAVSTTTSSEQAARLAAAAQAATAAAVIAAQRQQASNDAGGSQAAGADAHQAAAVAAASGSAQAAASCVSEAVGLVAVRQELQPGWLLLRMICAQCAAVAASVDADTRSSAVLSGVVGAPAASLLGTDSSSVRAGWQHGWPQAATLLQAAATSSGSGSSRASVQPEQVLRVVQAYSSHIATGPSDAQQVPGLLRSLHFLMCQSVLVLRHGPSQLLLAHQQRQQAQEEQYRQRERLQWLSLTTDPTSESCSSDDGRESQLGAGGHQLLTTAAGVLDLICAGSNSTPPPTPPPSGVATGGAAAARAGGSSGSSSVRGLPWTLTASVYVALAVTVYLQERAPANAAGAANGNGTAPAASAAGVERLSASDSCLALQALQLAAAALKLLLPVLTGHAFVGGQAAAPDAVLAEGVGAAAAGQQQQSSASPLVAVLPVYEPLACSLAALQAIGVLSSLLQPALPGLLSQCIHSSSGYLGHGAEQRSHSSSGGSSSSSRNRHHSHHASRTQVTVHAAKTAIAAAAAALDSDLQRLLAQAVLSWQAPPSNTNSTSTTTTSTGSASSITGSQQQQQPQQQLLQLSVEAALHQHLLQELRCWSAAALASCYGQLGARTWQGAVLEQFREPGAPFADVQLQLGDSGGAVAGHAAVLAAGCPVLRQQLLSAASVAGGGAPAASPPSSGRLVLKLSAAVDAQALHKVLDFVYTGAAVVPDAGLASQLQLCDSALNTPAAPHSSRQQHQQGLLAQQHQQGLLAHQQRQLQDLHDQQHVAQQQLHKLSMLARKLQLPLLAAVSRGHRPQPGQRLPDLHLSFDALLPQHLLLQTPVGTVSAAAEAATPGRHQSQQDTATEEEKEAEAAEGWQEQKKHPSSEAYLSLLLSATTATASASVVDGGAALSSHDVLGPPSAASSLGQVSSHTPASFPDVLLAAPAQVAVPRHSFVEKGGCCSCAGPVLQQQGVVGQILHQQPQQQQQQPEEDQEEQQQEQGVAFAYLPAHRVLLSACCPYFEALLSQRWQHDEHGGADYHAQHVQQQQQELSETMRPQQQEHAAARVVVVPEAGIHVAAALQHYLYTGTLRMQLPEHVVVCCRSPPPAAGSTSAAAAVDPSGSETAAASDAAAAVSAASGASCCIALNGCCAGCHQARTLLRLWRCAELLLLSGLQALCVAAVDAAAWQLDNRCILVLLADCVHLGVPAAADGLLAALAQRGDREHTISLPEWSDLPAGLQAVLIKAWADRRRDQEDSSAQGQLASAAAAGAGAQPLAVVGPSLTPSSAVVQPLVAASTGGAGVVAQPPPLPAAGQQASGGLMLVGQEQRAAAAAATPAGVSLQCVRALQQAAKSLSDAVSTQLHTPGS